MFQFSPSLDVLYVRSESLRKIQDEKRFMREAQLRRELSEVVEREAQRKKFSWRRRFHPAGA